MHLFFKSIILCQSGLLCYYVEIIDVTEDLSGRIQMNISVYLVVLEIIACMYFLQTFYCFPDKLIKEKIISHKMLNLAKYEYFPYAFVPRGDTMEPFCLSVKFY